MNTTRLTQQAASMMLAALVTCSVMFGLNGLASPDSAAIQQIVASASAPRA
jgi:hypothetical protein